MLFEWAIHDCIHGQSDDVIIWIFLSFKFNNFNCDEF